MEILYGDNSILLVVKPAGALSTDEPGGVPELARQALGDPAAEIRTVHRLDRVAGGLMLLARSAQAASGLSEQIRQGSLRKEYLAVVHGESEDRAQLRDLMFRDRARKMSFVTDTPGKGVQKAALDYETLGRSGGMSLLRVRLYTGRTHQIRCQLAARGLPLVGERKYSSLEDDCPLALWSCRLAFRHPESGERMDFALPPPSQPPWTIFDKL